MFNENQNKEPVHHQRIVEEKGLPVMDVNVPMPKVEPLQGQSSTSTTTTNQNTQNSNNNQSR